MFAIQTPSTVMLILLASFPMIAAIPPFPPWPLLLLIVLARCHTKRHSVFMSKAPEAYNAETSPSECPAAKSGEKPALVKMSYVPTEQATVVGCAMSDDPSFS